MIDRLDGVMVAVRDADRAAGTYETIFGGKRGQRRTSEVLSAGVVPVHVGVNEILLAEPSGAGPVAEHVERWGEGLFAALYSTTDLDAVHARLREHGALLAEEPDTLHLTIEGLPLIVVPRAERERVGALSFFYEVTHLVDNWQTAAARYVDVFGLDPDRFSPISSDTYGYDGTLTLFDPPGHLDRVEVVTPYGDKAMARFFRKRGQGAYMCFAETDDITALGRRLSDAGARYAGDTDAGRTSIFVHPSATHGVLIGVSPTNLAWQWSGRPELAKASE